MRRFEPLHNARYRYPRETVMMRGLDVESART
jgi:hypothetical protein